MCWRTGRKRIGEDLLGYASADSHVFIRYLWSGAYAEGLIDDVVQLYAAYRLAIWNPLARRIWVVVPCRTGTLNACWDSEGMHHNVVYAQMSRVDARNSRFECAGLFRCDAVAAGYGCMSLYQPEFWFHRLPDELTTGSSIMPYKELDG